MAFVCSLVGVGRREGGGERWEELVEGRIDRHKVEPEGQMEWGNGCCDFRLRSR